MNEEKAPLVAEVLILRRAKQLAEPFDYLIPHEIAETCEPGKIVRVPFGASEATGIVIDIKLESEFERLKPVFEVLDTAPSLKLHQIELLKWMSSFYVESPGSVISLFLPVGFTASLEKYVTALTGEMHPELYSILVNRGGTAPYKEIEVKLGRIRATSLLKDALKKESVKVYWVLPRRKIKPKITYEILIAGKEEFEAALNRTRSKRLKAFLSELKEKGMLTLEIASGEFGINLSELKKLESIGAVRLVERYLSRADTQKVETFDGSVELTEFQNKALEAIKDGIKRRNGSEFLLFGPTGSGKTEVYLRAAKYAQELGLGVIFLVPEISLTPQTFSRVERVFGSSTAVFHSGLKATERLDEWVQVEQGLKNVVVGARSALFVPMEKPGLIIIDEEHDTSYRQETSPTYDARRVARKIAELTGCAVIYGSATPSVERFYEAKKGRIRLLSLPERVSGKKPVVEIVDLKKERTLISKRLKEELEKTIEAGEKAIIFLNRRGYAVVEVCDECGYLATCPRCSIYLRYHRDTDKLMCHYCGYSKKPDKNCPQCGSSQIVLKGRGIQRVEKELKELIKGKVPVIRIDSDVARSGGVKKGIFSFFSPGPAVLVGTQMIAKGLHLPQVTLVGVVNADVGLNLPDFRAEERTFQLIVQVMGRCGRGEREGKVIIQTWQPERSVIRFAAAENYKDFYDNELSLRRANSLPPYKFIVRVLVSSADERSAIVAASELERRIKAELSEDAEIRGPFPAPLYLLNKKYRIQILLKFEGEPDDAILDKIRRAVFLKVKNVKISVEVDPQVMI